MDIWRFRYVLFLIRANGKTINSNDNWGLSGYTNHTVVNDHKLRLEVSNEF